jgi:hypothetical protein
MDGGGRGTLRAKYLDWCSARLAERFLDLSPEEIYELAQPAGGAEGVATEGRSVLPHPTDDSYRQLVERVTEALLVRVPLPSFEQWAEAYAEDPARFDAELLGLWKEAVESESVEGESAGGTDAPHPASPGSGGAEGEGEALDTGGG